MVVSTFISTVTVFLGAMLIWQEYQRCVGNKIDVVLNIDVLNIAYFMFLQIQCSLALQLSVTIIGETTLYVSDDQMIGVQLALFFAFLIYVGIGKYVFDSIQLPNVYRCNEYRGGGIAFSLVAMSFSCLVGYVILKQGLSAYIDVVGSRLYREDNAFLIYNIIGFLLVSCAYAIFSVKSFRAALICIVVFFALSLFSGGRGAILSAVFLLAAIMIRFEIRVSLWRLFLTVVLPMVALLSVYTQHVRYANFAGQELSSNIYFEGIVESESLAIWKSIYAVYTTDFRLDYPFYSVLSAMSFPIPRALFQDKLIPPSSVFTALISPVRFDNNGSEITISGFGASLSELGYVAGPIYFGFVLSVVAFLIRVIRRGSGIGPQILFLMFFDLTFWRADMFTASRVLWSAAFIRVLIFVISLFSYGGRRPVRGLRQRSGRSY